MCSPPALCCCAGSQPDAAFEQDGVQAGPPWALGPRGMAGKRGQGGQDPLSFPLWDPASSPGRWSSSEQRLALQRCFLQRGWGWLVKPPRVTGMLTASWAAWLESSLRAPAVEPAGLTPNPCSRPGLPGKTLLSQPPCPAWVAGSPLCSSQKDGVCFDVLLRCPKWGWGCCVSLSILPRYRCCLLGALKHSGEPLEGKMWG